MNEHDRSRFEILKNSVVKSMFIDMADRDYVASRLAYRMQMYNLFFWSAGQAIEKYLKASLLLNGKSAKFGHDLIELFQEVSKYAADLFPEKLTKPDELSSNSWREESPSDFLIRFNEYANPHTRYNLTGYVTLDEDLFHLDQFVFAVRRMAVALEAYPFISPKSPRPGSPRTMRELLKRAHRLQPYNLEFKKALEKIPDLSMHEAALSGNFPFAPPGHVHEDVRVGTVLSIPVLDFMIVGEEENSSEALVAAALADWTVANIRLPKCLEKNLRNEAVRLRGA